MNECTLIFLVHVCLLANFHVITAERKSGIQEHLSAGRDKAHHVVVMPQG